MKTPALRVRASERGGCTVLTPSGPFGLAHMATMRRHLDKAFRGGRPVCVDLALVSRPEAVAVTCFTTAYALAGGWPTVVLVLARPDAEMSAHLHGTGVSRRVRVFMRLEDALAAAVADARPEVVSKQVNLPADRSSAGIGRREVDDFWRLTACEGPSDDAVTVVSELVGNAVVHGEPPIVLTFTRTLGSMIVGVHDASPRMPRQRSAGDSEAAGRGLAIVAALSAGWGAHSLDGHGKVVFARISARVDAAAD